MTMSDDEAWFARKTDGAPPVLRRRADRFFHNTSGEELTARLSAAGRAALAAATRDGAGRAAALDLLAADTLITLALLASAERAPGDLSLAAVALRMQPAPA